MPLFSDRKSAAPDHMPPPSLPLLALELRAPWEFAAVLPGVSPTEAQAIAERVRSAVERQALDATQGGPQRATVSIGLVHSATLGADADMDTLLLAADTALYRAKAEGRNRVMVG